MSNHHQNSISWYANVYYSYRDYPIKHLNIKYKKSQLKGIYNTLIRKMFTNFQINIQNPQNSERNNSQNSPFSKKPIQDIISKLNKTESFSDRNSENSISIEKQSSRSEISIDQKNKNIFSFLNQQQDIKSQNKILSYENFSSKSSISTLKNIQKSKQSINKILAAPSNPFSQKSNKNLTNQLNLLQISEQSPTLNQANQNKNMDVLYELMIGMIRLTMKRITVEIDQQIKLAKENEKKFQIIDEQMEKSENGDDQSDDSSDFKTLTQKSKSYINSNQNINSSSDIADEDNNYKFVITYAALLGQTKKKNEEKMKQKQKERKKIRQGLQNECKLCQMQYPQTLEQLKFQFLKYCITTNLSYAQPNTRLSKDSQQPKIPNNGKFSDIQEQSQQVSAIDAKVRLQTYFTQLTELDERQIKQSNQKETVSEMQRLVMKLANFQMKAFNSFVNHYFKKIQQANAIVNVIGLDAITDSMCQMALGKQARNNGIKTQVGLGNMQIKLFSNSVSQQNSNILLSTWVDLVLFAEDPKLLYEITQNLNKQSKSQQVGHKKRKTWTPSIFSNPISVNQHRNKQSQEIMYQEKMLSLLNFLILNTTKNVFLESISKANFLSVVMIQILPNRQDRRSLKQFELRPLKQSQITKQKQHNSSSRYLTSQDQAIIVYDLNFQKQVWLKESLDLIFLKWKKVIQIIFQEQIKNQNIYWELVFQKSVTLINRQLSLLTVLVFNLVQILENVTSQVKWILESQKVNQWTKRQVQKCEHVKLCIQFIIKELIGCSEIFGIQETQTVGAFEDKYSFNFSSTLNGHKEFNRSQNGFKFINREQNSKELVMWQQIIKQNILILENYILNIESIKKIFQSKPYHTASWVINFHKEAKTLMKKVKTQNLGMFFQKFLQKIPKLWANLNSQQKQQKQQTFSPLKRNGFIANKQRISSIKRRNEMTFVEKQALIINYMIKAQLQLYESYTKSHVLNCRDQSSTMTTIVSGNSTIKSNRPFIFEDLNLESLLIFNFKGSSVKNQKDLVSNNLFAKRSPKMHLTLKPLSNFAPTPSLFPLSPRKPQKKDDCLETCFKKSPQISFGKVIMKQKQATEKLQVTEYQIDVSLLQTIKYSSEQIEFLQQLNNHLKLINEINFEYEYYYWKNVAYEKKFNLKNGKKEDQTSQTKSTQQQQAKNLEQSQQQHQEPLSESQCQSNSNQKKVTFHLKKMVTYNQYTKQKIQNLLTTQQLYQQLAQINKALIGTRSQFANSDTKDDDEKYEMKLVRYHSVEMEDRDEIKNLYQQKIIQYNERFKLHNDSLIFIVNAALQAKNYWKAVSTNVFPDDEFLNEQKQQYIIKNQNKLQKISENEIQTHFQERFFEKKILHKLEEYINYYREISKQMNFTIESGKLPEDIPLNNEADDQEGEQDEDENGENDIVSQKKSINNKGITIEKDSQNESQCQKISVKEKKSRKTSNKKPSIFQTIESKTKSKVRIYSLLQALICKKQQPKMNRFQIAASIYQFSQKILRLNCYMASFYVERRIYLDIISNQELSQDKYLKVKIIGKQYFEKIKKYSDELYVDKQITQENLKNVQLVYEKKVLLIMISLLQLLYYGNEHTKTIVGNWKYESSSMKQRLTTVRDVNDKQFQRGYKNHGFKLRKNTLKKYSELFKKYLKWRFRQNTTHIFAKEGLNNIYQTNQGDEQSKSDYFFISKLLSEAFQFGQVNQIFDEQKFIKLLRKLRTEERDEQFLKFYILILEKENSYLSEFSTEQEKVTCLQKKFNYLVLREIYFFLYYDIDCLQEKSSYSKKNYELYENRILSFYQQIIKKSYEDFMTKKQMELKKRSVYLQNYLLKYEDEPTLAKVQKNLNKLLVCVFNQVMLIYTQDIKMEIKKKSQQIQAINHLTKKTQHQPLHTHYLSCQFYQDKSLFKKKQPEAEEDQEKVEWNNPNSPNNLNGPNSLFAQTLPTASMKLLNNIIPALTNQRDSSLLINFNNNKKKNNEKTESEQYHRDSNRSAQSHHHIPTFRIFTIQSMNLHEAINIYQSLKQKDSSQIQKGLLSLKDSFKNTKSLKRDDLTEMQIKTLETNEESIVSLLKRQIIEKINQMKFDLVQKNLISRIQKLYINLDVRHKVFESFKDKILSYEMQKAKIYHQYMDYIRGLKLDVYSHIANEDSLPYIKILNAIKFYRLEVKKQELENKVRQQFGKNLHKWNEGIQEDLLNYNQWLDSEEHQWQKAKISVSSQKNQFLVIYDAIKKQLRRQSKKRLFQESKKLKASTQTFKNDLDFNFNKHKKQDKAKQLKKVPMNKKNLFMVQKEKIQVQPGTQGQKDNQLAKVSLFTAKNIQFDLNRTVFQNPNAKESPQNLFKAITIENPSIKKSNSMHNIPHRSLSKYSSKSKQKIPLTRPTTSMHSENRLSVQYAKSKNGNNRASTAVTRQKSMDLDNSEFRGIKMKFVSKSIQKSVDCGQSRHQQEKNFKRSTYHSGFDERIFSGHVTNNSKYLVNQNGRNSNNEMIQSKSRALLKQVRNVVSAVPERKGIIKNF